MSGPMSAAGTLWACLDCTLARENGEAPDAPDAPGFEPWALEPSLDVTLGRVDCERGDGDWLECECCRDDFSSRECDACGNRLAGERYAYTYWA